MTIQSYRKVPVSNVQSLVEHLRSLLESTHSVTYLMKELAVFKILSDMLDHFLELSIHTATHLMEKFAVFQS